MLESITSESSTVSLWDYLKEELTAADFETTQELKRERVANFLSVPIAFEKVRGGCLLMRWHGNDINATASMLDACFWLFRVPGLVSLQLHYFAGSICSCYNRSISIHLLEDMVFQEFRKNVSSNFLVHV